MNYTIISSVFDKSAKLICLWKIDFEKLTERLLKTRFFFVDYEERNLITFDYIELLKDDFKKMHESAASSSSKCLIVIWQSSIHFHYYLLCYQSGLFEICN